MWDNLTTPQWVALAWIELVIVYAGYLWYLNWRARKAEEER
ncbi:MAG TPA: hypothetical protein VFN03_05460 [Trueperaceae bacterium]|nr:hypothetical protein [Trueperaceae bacterium]